jgi:tRNA threonylcarbamoyl adenosine modification protein (Sua5/YciO/YrdC/YwlC family)
MRIRNLKAGHLFTIICADLSGLGTLARIDNSAFRLIKNLTPGPYTFILKASRDVPRRLQNPKRRTIGLRVPDNTVCHELLCALDHPMLSTSLILPGHDSPEQDPEKIRDELGKMIDLVIDGGMIGSGLTTVIDLSGGSAELVRQGVGAFD